MRDVAYWPKTFLDEVERSTPVDGVRFFALGGPSFVYRTPQTTIWIDPYFYGTPDDAVPDAYRATAIPINPEEVTFGDVIISTHDHIDHCHQGTLLPILRNTSAVCVAAPSSADKMRAFGIPDARVRPVAPGEGFQIRDVAFQVYGSHDPGEPGAVTFVLTAGGVSLFVSGDTADGPTLAQVAAAHQLDYALLAFGRTWYMDEAQLLTAARTLRPKVLLPFHWEFWRNHTGDINRLFELYYREPAAFKLHILLIGDSLHMRPDGN